jgi:hypothetical protein
MTAFQYQCPNTGQQVQGWSADEIEDANAYQTIKCMACGRIHLVNPQTGKVAGGN